jgi:hypothetical protein
MTGNITIVFSLAKEPSYEVVDHIRIQSDVNVPDNIRLEGMTLHTEDDQTLQFVKRLQEVIEQHCDIDGKINDIFAKDPSCTLLVTITVNACIVVPDMLNNLTSIVTHPEDVFKTLTRVCRMMTQFENNPYFPNQHPLWYDSQMNRYATFNTQKTLMKNHIGV